MSPAQLLLGFRAWLALLSFWPLLSSQQSLALEPVPQASDTRPTPFLRLRDATLSYNGPDAACTNLTEIRIGWFGPYDAAQSVSPRSGASSSPRVEAEADAAVGMWHAANMAVQEANSQGGLGGLPFQLVPCWTRDPWGSGIALLTRMIYDQQPLAILGSVDSATTPAG
jgi:hypothetical protein